MERDNIEPKLCDPELHLQGSKAKIIETRKTVPGLRVLDKWAVLIGGGANHHSDLSHFRA